MQHRRCPLLSCTDLKRNSITMSDSLRTTIHNTAQAIGEQLQFMQATISTAESCTGGMLASSLCAVAGASGWFDTGIIAYTYESKQKHLGIAPDILNQGLVTQATAEAMATNICKISETSYALSTTGVCGPSESEGYPPCHVWIAIVTPSGIQSRLIKSEDRGREENILTVTLAALELLLQHLTTPPS